MQCTEHSVQKNFQKIDRYGIPDHTSQGSWRDGHGTCFLSEIMREPLQPQHLFGAHKTLLMREAIATRHTAWACQTWRLVIRCGYCLGIAINDIGFLHRRGTMFLQLFAGCIKRLRRPSSLARVGSNGLLVLLDLCKDALKTGKPDTNPTLAT